MRKALPEDWPKVAHLLTAAFLHNRSVNWIIKKGGQKEKQIKGLTEYALEESSRANGAWITEDEKGALLFTRPNQKSGKGLAAMLSSLKLALSVIGLFRLPQVLRREKYVKNKHPKEDFIYLWFIGVDPGYQGHGVGSTILLELLALADLENLPVYLETSTPENLHFYKKHHFKVYHEWQDPKAGFPVWFLKREVATPA